MSSERLIFYLRMEHRSKCIYVLLLIGFGLVMYTGLYAKLKVPEKSSTKSNSESILVVKKDISTDIKPHEDSRRKMANNENGKEPANKTHSRTDLPVTSKIDITRNVDIVIKPIEESDGNTSCKFSFDKNDLLQAKDKLFDSSPFYLFYINLKTDPPIFQSFSREEIDSLLHWQYIKKKEDFLVRLPIDIDLLTFKIFFADHEETVLDIKLLYDNSNCVQNHTYEYFVHSIRSLLWSELFLNNSNYYLCHRNFEKECLREALYYITTVWVGFDLTCSEASFSLGVKEVQLNKDQLPIIEPLICFVLSLQFVWSFTLLDLHSIKSITQSNSHLLNPYVKDDRPCGLKRFLIKLLFKYSTCKCNCISKLINNPVRRLLFLLWFLILLTFGLYRTIGRYILNESIFEDYTNVVRPNEPVLLIFSSDTAIFVIDILYAVIFPLLYIIIVRRLYKKFVQKNVWFVPCKSQDYIEKEAIFDSPMISDKFAFPCFLICSCSCSCNADNNCTCVEPCLSFLAAICGCLYCLLPCIPFHCNKGIVGKTKTKGFQLYFKILVYFILLYLLCLRPILSTFTFLLRSFTFLVFVTLPIRSHIFRFTFLIVITLIYIFKYFSEIINMNVEILQHIFHLVEEYSGINHIDKIPEKVYGDIYVKLGFVRKTFYIFIFQILVVSMFFFIAIKTFIINRDSLTGPDFSNMVQFLLLSLSPYAINLILKLNKENFLTDENKTEIKKVFRKLLENDNFRSLLNDCISNNEEERGDELSADSDDEQNEYEQIV